MRSTGIVDKLAERKRREPRKPGVVKAAKNVTAFLDGKKLDAAVYQRDELPTGARLQTPCIVTEYSSTTLVPSGASVRVDNYANLIIKVT